MRLTSSFTNRPRYPAPDVARGFMLLLIAVANVPFWTGLVLSGSLSESSGSTADAVWLAIRAMLVDRRAMPLFALLFGFGLMVMINRRIESGTRGYLESLGPRAAQAPTEAQLAWAKELATVDARRLVRRRGWWMLLFGGLHSVFFAGDVIGSYGLVAVVFAGWLARKRRRRLLAAALLPVLVLLLSLSVSLFFQLSGGGGTVSGSGADASGLPPSPFPEEVPWFLLNPGFWALITLTVMFLTMTLPAVFLGARLADSDLLSHPERHRRLLLGVGAGGLAIAALGALHKVLAVTGASAAWAADTSLVELTGLAGACGWLALLALYAGGARPEGELRGLRRVLSAVGRRSMTAYLSQTVLFGLVLVIVPAVIGADFRPGPALAAAIAVGVWLCTVVLCLLLERAGRPGPFETALRTAVANSARARPVPPPPEALPASGQTPEPHAPPPGAPGRTA